jgi:hypothetical protein
LPVGVAFAGLGLGTAVWFLSVFIVGAALELALLSLG